MTNGPLPASRVVDQFVTGEAVYTDDVTLPVDAVHVALGLSNCAAGRLLSLDASRVLDAADVVAVIKAADVPGTNVCSQLGHDPIFVERDIEYAGQVLFAVVARSARAAEAAVRLAAVRVERLDAVVSLADARRTRSVLREPMLLVRGDWQAALDDAPNRIAGILPIGGQEHFYLEGQVALAMPEPNGEIRVIVSTQHSAEVQHLVADTLGLQAKDVVVQCPRLGGGFGGKETQASQFACIAALASRITGKAAKVCLPRRDDMQITGKRHDMEAHYAVGFDSDGHLMALDLRLDVRCGFSPDLSAAVCTRAMLHADNAYFVPHVRIEAHLHRTNTASNTAFRGFGAPQAILVIETILDRIARTLGIDPVEIRRRNYYGSGRGNETPYGMTMENTPLARLTDELIASSNYSARRRDIDRFNASSQVLKRGMAFVPVKFGLSFTQTWLNQAGVLLNIYSDGSIRLAHGGTEMGQGLSDKVETIVARAFGVSPARLRVVPADTSRVPNASPTAASVSSDLIGQAAVNAVEALRARLLEFAATHWTLPRGECVIDNDELRCGNVRVPFSELVRCAYQARIELSSTGFYRTPDIHFNVATMQGRPFHYFVHGVAVSEVIVDILTGEQRLLRVDILQDVGHSLVPEVDRGQIEGGFIQGAGWLTMEQLVWSPEGQLLTEGPDTYKIPTASDQPPTFNVSLAAWSENHAATVFRSKGIGEPPLPLAVSVFLAIRDAIASVNTAGAFTLPAPATPEAILFALTAFARSGTAADERMETCSSNRLSPGSPEVTRTRT